MKKIRFFLPVFAFGALLFGMAGCDTGNDDFVNETPTTWKSLGNEVDSSVDAWWTFASDVDNLGTSEVVHPVGMELTADAGSKGATLAVGNEYGFKYVVGSGTDDTAGKSTGAISASRKSATLADPSKGLYFTLTTTGATNITVRAKGAGPATEARILLITDESDTPIVKKDWLGSAGDYTIFHIKGAPAGTYKIYCNGSKISEIAASSVGNDIEEAKGYENNDALDVIEELYEPLSGGDAYEALVESCYLKAKEKSGSDITASAVWEILDGDDIATVNAGVVSAKSKDSEGTVKIRARVGRFYTETYEVTFKKCTHQFVTTFAGNNMPESGTVIYWDYAERYADKANATDDQKEANRKLRDAEIKKINKISRLVYSGKSDVGITEENTSDTTDAKASKATVTLGEVVKVYPLTEDDKKKYNYEYVTSRSNEFNVSKGTSFQWKDDAKVPETNALSADLPVGTGYVSFTFTVDPATGKTPRLSGICGTVTCGLGDEKMVGKVSINGEDVGVPYSVKKTLSARDSTIFDTPVPITGKTDITLRFELNAVTKGASLQVRDVGLIFE